MDGVSRDGGGVYSERICETGRFYAGSERSRELWMMRVVNQQEQDDATGVGAEESEIETQ